MNKQIKKKIEDKCKELDLIELEKKKKEVNNIKWLVLSGIVIILIILILLFNNVDQNRIDKVKEEKIIDGKVQTYSNNNNVTEVSEYLTNSFGKNFMLLLSITIFELSIYYFVIKPMLSIGYFGA